jgi:hypothetical protein
VSGRPAWWWRRSTHRSAHFLLAAVLGAFVYSPFTADPTFRLVVQVIAFPAMVATGLLLWRGPALRRWLRTRRGAR